MQYLFSVDSLFCYTFSRVIHFGLPLSMWKYVGNSTLSPFHPKSGRETGEEYSQLLYSAYTGPLSTVIHGVMVPVAFTPVRVRITSYT